MHQQATLHGKKNKNHNRGPDPLQKLQIRKKEKVKTVIKAKAKLIKTVRVIKNEVH